MTINCGVIGLPKSGRKMLLSFLAGRPVSHSSTKTVSVKKPDARLEYLSNIYTSKEKVYSTIEIKILPEIETETTEKELSEQDLVEEIRKSDALIYLVRAFKDESVYHIDGSVDPKRDLEKLNSEMIFYDFQLTETRIDRIKESTKQTQQEKSELSVLNKCREILEEEKPISSLDLSEQEWEVLQHLEFITSKPAIILVNIDEEQQLESKYDNRDYIHSWAEEREYPLAEINVQLEKEICELDHEEQEQFLEELGIQSFGVNSICEKVYLSLNLVTFLTVGSDELRAWTVKEGTTAKKAAGKVHSDIERGFIRAEVIGFEDFKACGSEKAARDKGLYRLEGKDYVVKDGDIIKFRFNV